MEKFTASEVRVFMERYKSGDVAWGEADDYLKELAGLLEAQEKAVPVMVVNHVSSAEHDLPIGMKLYTHPAPADAEPPSSLQEALCVLENAALHGLVLHGDDIPRLRATVDKIAPDKPQPDAERLAEALHSIGERLSSVLCDPFGEVVVRGSDDDRQIIAQALKDLGELAAHYAQAVKSLGSLGLTEEQLDAIRFRALCADYGDLAIRAKVRRLIDRLPVMSLSAARSAIDGLTRNIAQPKIGDFDARDSFTVHINTTTLQQNAAEAAPAQPPAASVRPTRALIAQWLRSPAMADFLDGVKHAFRCLALILLLPVFLVALLLVGLQNLWNSTR